MKGRRITGSGDRSQALREAALLLRADTVTPDMFPDLMEQAADEMDRMKEVIVEANNSLYGSQSYFLVEENGKTKYHLANGIENLKTESRKAYVRIRELEEELEEREYPPGDDA